MEGNARADGGASGEIWLGDLLRASAALGVGPGDWVRWDALTRCLGLGSDRPSEAEQSQDAARDTAGAPLPESLPRTGVRETWTRAPEASQRAGDPGGDYVPPLLGPLYVGDFGPGPWTEEPLPTAPAAKDGPALWTEPLLAPGSESSMLRMLTGKRVPEGPIDVVRLVEMISTAGPVESLPRESVRTFRFGVQLFVDLGEGMGPFLEDEEYLAERVRAVVGTHNCDVVYFAEHPRLAGPGPGWTWRPYRPPTSGTRVLILSDFGLNTGRPGSVSELAVDWRALVRMLNRAGCSPVALVPCTDAGMPDWLTSLMPALSWDRTTTTSSVRTRLG